MATVARRDHRRLSAGRESVLHGLTVGCTALWQIGAYIDVWYHVHRGFEIDTFFTWAHTLLYAGWVSAGLVPLAYRRWTGARLPPGYTAFLLGVALFGLGGAADFVWHSLFGFEVGHDAVLSPPHIMLVVSFTIAALGLLRATVLWRQHQAHERPGFTLADACVALCLGMLLRATSWYLIYVDPLTIDFATGGAVSRSLGGFSGIGWDASTARIAGTAGILLRSVVVSLFLVVALRHLRLPAGGITLMLLYDALLIAPATDQWLTIPAVVGAAAAGEAVWAWMQRGGLGGQDGEPACWVIGGLVPLVQTALMLTISGLTAGVVWTPHLLAGVPVAAGILGATVAVLAVPPAFLRFTEPVAGQR